MTLQVPTFQKAIDGTPYYITQAKLTVKLTGEDTGGSYTLLELSAPSGLHIAPHTHTLEDEVFFVITGSMRLTCGSSTSDLGPGDCAFLPRGIAHSFEVTSDGLRVVQIASPPGFENMLAELGDVSASPRPLSSYSPDDVKRVMQVTHAYGQTVTPLRAGGPPNSCQDKPLTH